MKRSSWRRDEIVVVGIGWVIWMAWWHWSLLVGKV